MNTVGEYTYDIDNRFSFYGLSAALVLKKWRRPTRQGLSDGPDHSLPLQLMGDWRAPETLDEELTQLFEALSLSAASAESGNQGQGSAGPPALSEEPAVAEPDTEPAAGGIATEGAWCSASSTTATA